MGDTATNVWIMPKEISQVGEADTLIRFDHIARLWVQVLGRRQDLHPLQADLAVPSGDAGNIRPVSYTIAWVPVGRGASMIRKLVEVAAVCSYASGGGGSAILAESDGDWTKL